MTLYTTSEAASQLHISPAYLRELCQDPALDASQRTPGKHRRFSEADIERVRGALTRRERPAAPRAPDLLQERWWDASKPALRAALAEVQDLGALLRRILDRRELVPASFELPPSPEVIETAKIQIEVEKSGREMTTDELWQMLGTLSEYQEVLRPIPLSSLHRTTFMDRMARRAKHHESEIYDEYVERASPKTRRPMTATQMIALLDEIISARTVRGDSIDAFMIDWAQIMPLARLEREHLHLRRLDMLINDEVRIRASTQSIPRAVSA